MATWKGRKERKTGEKPYAVFEAPGWRTEVLAIRQGPKAKGPYRIAFVRAITSMTSERGEMGDQYTSGIYGQLVDFDRDVFEDEIEVVKAVFGT